MSFLFCPLWSFATEAAGIIYSRTSAWPRQRTSLGRQKPRRSGGHVPLRKKIGTAWHVADAALFLASDAANFIAGVALPVDGGALVKIGRKAPQTDTIGLQEAIRHGKNKTRTLRRAVYLRGQVRTRRATAANLGRGQGRVSGKYGEERWQAASTKSF
jgi:Enoyl-(Acyl carrier protein) reductase